MDSNWKKEVMMEREKVTIPKLYEMKRKGDKIAFLTGYDFPTAALEDEAGIDMILIGDSGGMTTLGYSTTLPVTMDEMMVFTGSVCRTPTPTAPGSATSCGSTASTRPRC